MFKGLELNISATVAYLLSTILYGDGYWDFNGWLPSHMSSQNLICVPACKLKQPRLRNWSFTLIKLNQKWESPSFFITWHNILVFRYLFLSNSCQITSTLHNLNSHLLSGHLFFKFRFCMPKPPCFFGWHKIFHLTIVCISSYVDHIATKKILIYSTLVS